MICKNEHCRHEIPDDSQFCPDCGTPQDNTGGQGNGGNTPPANSPTGNNGNPTGNHQPQGGNGNTPTPNPPIPENLVELCFARPSLHETGESDSLAKWCYGSTQQPLCMNVDTAEILCSKNGKIAFCKEWMFSEENTSMILQENSSEGYTPMNESFLASMLGQLILKKYGIEKYQHLLSLISK